MKLKRADEYHGLILTQNEASKFTVKKTAYNSF